MTGDDTELPVSPVRTPTGRLLRDLNRQLSEASRVLAEEPSSPTVETAQATLLAAREALSLLLLERAAPAAEALSTELVTAPALVRRMELRPETFSAQSARSFCRETLSRWSVPTDTITSAVDITSELVTNAVRHTGSVVVLSVELHTDGLLISAWDDGNGRPRLLPYRPGVSERGIGLRHVNQLSQEWGWSEEQGGKWVWARLAVPEDGHGQARRSTAAQRSSGA